MLIGNLFVFFQFQGKDHIDAHTRHIVFTVLIAIAIVGVVFFCVLRRVHNTFEENGRDRELDYESSSNSISGAFVKAIKLFCTRDMLLLCITFLYTGKYMLCRYMQILVQPHFTQSHVLKFTLYSYSSFSNCFFFFFAVSRWHFSFKMLGFELSFYSGVYSPSIGFTLKIGESAKQLVGLSGICIGIGEIFGGVLFGLLGSKTIKYGRDPIVIIGFIVHLISFLLIYLNLPDDAPC